MIQLSEPESGISGQVVHADGSPVTRFMIDIAGKDPENPFCLSRSFSDRLGRFVILDLPSGDLEVQIMPADRELVPPIEAISIQLRKGMVYSDVVLVAKDEANPRD